MRGAPVDTGVLVELCVCVAARGGGGGGGGGRADRGTMPAMSVHGVRLTPLIPGSQNMVADFEVLREELGVEKWMLLGGSWGVTLSIAYAQAHPDRYSPLPFVPVLPALQ